MKLRSERMPKRFEDRLLSDTYREDVCCEVRFQPASRDLEGEALRDEVPERLLNRLRHLVLAYDLPLLGRLPQNGAVTFPEVQLLSLEDELEFLFEVVSDQALLDAVTPFRVLTGRAKNDPRGWSLVV